jgi:simple sugar transport system ATP-binding protein
MQKITKQFGEVLANDHIDLTVHKGEVHALLGENGAGKSTLMNILYGIYRPNAGTIAINGQAVVVSNPNVAIAHGIGMVHQHFMLIRPFSVAENIMLGREIVKKGGWLDRKRAALVVSELSEKYGLKVEPQAKIQDISVGMGQRVEILKVLYRGAEILILDEPTAVLTPQEIQELTGIIRNLTAEGKTVILITHKLGEIKMIADYCTIIRRGKRIATVQVSNVGEQELADMMVGRAVNFQVQKKSLQKGKVILKVEQLQVKDNRGLSALKGLDLEVHAGEILGIAGVDGNGQSELVEALNGLRKVEAGRVLMKEKDITNLTPRRIIEHGIGTIPEDRQRRGLVGEFTLAENMIIENHNQPPFSRRGICDFRYIQRFAKQVIQRFDVRPDDENYKAKQLSGGNQQKMIIAREITNNPEVLIAAQPTRGLDVGAIEYVQNALVAQRDNGKGVLLISLDLDEILNLADRIAVIFEGRIVGVLDAPQADKKTIGLMMAGYAPHPDTPE